MSNKTLSRWLAGIVLVITLIAMLWGPRSHAAGQEQWIVLSDNSSLMVAASPFVIAPDKQWTSILQSKTSHLFPTVVTGSGWMFNYGYTALKLEAIKALHPTGVIINLGTLDWATGQNVDLMRQRIILVVQGLKAAGLKVICLTPTYRSDERTRKGPNPGQMSALGHSLNRNPLVTTDTRPSYSDYIRSGCGMGGVQVVFGRNAPIGFANTGPLNEFTHYWMLPIGHEAFALFMESMLMNLGNIQPLPFVP